MTYTNNALKLPCFSKKEFRTGLQKSLLKKSFELISGSQFYTISFDAANRSFDRFEISLVFDKNDQRTTTFDSCNAELVSTIIGKVKVENIAKTYSVSDDIEFDLTNKDKKHQIYKHFVTYNCNEYLIAHTTADVRIYIDVTNSEGYTGQLEKLRKDDRQKLQ